MIQYLLMLLLRVMCFFIFIRSLIVCYCCFLLEGERIETHDFLLKSIGAVAAAAAAVAIIAVSMKPDGRVRDKISFRKVRIRKMK